MDHRAAGAGVREPARVVTGLAIVDASRLGVLKSHVDVPLLYRYLGGWVAHSGRSARCMNPSGHAHEDKTPSVQLYPDGWHCHGCGNRGDAVALVRLVRECGFRQAVAWLEDYSGISSVATARRPPPLPVRQRQETAPNPQDAADAWGLRRDVWRLVSDLPLTDSACRWLASRGIRPVTAHGLGCRDFALILPQLLKVLRAASPAAKRAAGFYSADGKPWFVLAGLAQGRSCMAGLGIPAWLPGDDAPVAWRWRFFIPLSTGGRKLKAAAMHGAVHPLGLSLPPTESWFNAAAGFDRIIICEGEPDFLSAFDAMQVDASAIGICDVSAGWRHAWDRTLRNARRVVVAVHATAKGRALAAGVADALEMLHGLDEAERRFAWIAFDEANDGNDHHARGELKPLLLHLLVGA